MELQNNQRRHERAPLDLYINKIIGDEPHLARVRDISAGGMYMLKLLEPAVGGSPNFGVEMKLPNSDEVIWAVAEVVRSGYSDDAAGVAVRFVRIAEADRQLIENYVEARDQYAASVA